MMSKTALVLCITAAPMLAAADNLAFRVTDAASGAPLSEAVVVLPLAATEADTDARMVEPSVHATRPGGTPGDRRRLS